VMRPPRADGCCLRRAHDVERDGPSRE
jgi:hypothetical protein